MPLGVAVGDLEDEADGLSLGDAKVVQRAGDWLARAADLLKERLDDFALTGA